MPSSEKIASRWFLTACSILGEISRPNRSRIKVYLKCQSHYITYTSVKNVRDDANQLSYSCSISVSHTSVWSEGFKISSQLTYFISFFFNPSAFMRVTSAAAAAVEPLSSQPDLLKHFSFDWTRAQEEIKNPVAGIRPPSNLIRGGVYKSLNHLCPPDTSTVPRRRDCEDGTQPARLRLEILSGIFHHFPSCAGNETQRLGFVPCTERKFAYISCGKQRKKKRGGRGNTLGSILN